MPDTPTTNQVNDTARTAFPESSNVTAVALATPPGKDKGKCFSFFDILSKEPSTVSLADLGLFEADVIDLIVSFGFDLSQLAHVLSLPEAGRTKECLSSWKLVTNSKWVLNIIESGSLLIIILPGVQRTQGFCQISSDPKIFKSCQSMKIRSVKCYLFPSSSLR